MSTIPKTARQRADAIRLALDTTPVGTVSITVDGQTVNYDREQAVREWQLWTKIAARESGRRPISSRIDLSGF